MLKFGIRVIMATTRLTFLYLGAYYVGNLVLVRIPDYLGVKESSNELNGSDERRDIRENFSRVFNGKKIQD